MPRCEPDRADCYRITACAPTGPLAEARLSRSSAVVLAIKWEALAYRNVEIATPSGKPYSLSTFRARFVPVIRYA